MIFDDKNQDIHSDDNFIHYLSEDSKLLCHTNLEHNCFYLSQHKAVQDFVIQYFGNVDE